MSRTEKSLETMKTIRLLYPDHVSGGLEAYYFGAHLLTHILPQNERQPLVKVDIAPPDHKEKEVEEGIYAREEVLAGIEDAAKKIEGEKPDRIITIGEFLNDIGVDYKVQEEIFVPDHEILEFVLMCWMSISSTPPTLLIRN